MGALEKHGSKLSAIAVGAVATLLGAPTGAIRLAVSASDLIWIGAEALKGDTGTDLRKRIDGVLERDAADDPDLPVLQALFDDSRTGLEIDLGNALDALRNGRDGDLPVAITDALTAKLRFDGHSEKQMSRALALLEAAVRQVLATDELRARFTEAALIDLVRETARNSATLRALLGELRAQRRNGLALSRKLAETVGDIYVDLTFSARKTDFTGREEEKRRLAEFLSAPEQLLWWQIAGPGGEGKSRIALDLVDGLDDRWYGGFLSSRQLAETDWTTVRFHEPTLIVIDYLAAPHKAAAFAAMIVTLRARERGGMGSGAEPLGHRVRVLALEREPCYLGEARSDRPIRNWLSEQVGDPARRGALLATAFNRPEGSR